MRVTNTARITPQAGHPDKDAPPPPRGRLLPRKAGPVDAVLAVNDHDAVSAVFQGADGRLGARVKVPQRDLGPHQVDVRGHRQARGQVEGEPNLAERFRQAAAQLARMYAIARTHRDLVGLRDDIAFFEEVRMLNARFDAEERKARGETIPSDVELYLRSLTASAIEAGGVTDIYAVAGIGRPNLSHLDDAFIARMREQRNPHLAVEALRRLVEQEMRAVTKHNIVKQKSFAERLEDLMRKYTNQNLSAAQIIAELVAMAKEVSADANRSAGFTPPLNPDELAFYDAVAQNESAVTEMGGSVLANITRDLVRTLRRDITTDWIARDDVRAKIRSTIKRLLAKYDYPPDAAKEAIQRPASCVSARTRRGAVT